MKSFQENIDKYNNKLLRLKKLLNRIALLRLCIFLVSSAILIYFLSINLITPVYFVLPVSIICFAFVIKYHKRIAYLKKHTLFLKKINESEILREKSNLKQFDKAYQFINQNHPYTSDLDIFGENSIFQLINRTTTESGAILLSKWLSEPAIDNEIHDRQKAIKELTQKLDWRQDFQASGMHFHNKNSDYYNLLDWVAKPLLLLKYRVIYQSIALIFPIILLMCLYLYIINITSQFGLIYLSIMILVWLFGFYIIRRIRPMAEDIVETSTKNLKTLRAYQTLINKIESESFNSEKLDRIQSLLIKNKKSACNEINKICRLLDFSHQRPIKKQAINGNLIYPILNSLFLIDIHLIIETEKWKSENKEYLKPWAETVNEFEVLNSFAAFSYANPSYTFPEITKRNNYVYFESLGHPLINSESRVTNNFESNSESEIIIITGSNMAGKSTFLRSVGVNLVLALAGSVCCAKNARVSNLCLFTSMRTSDNLKNGISSFYAELNRIEKMLKLIENNKNIYFLLDEMLKGTNSEDRHKGGFSLINQLNSLKTSGIIASHDIELAKLSEDKNLVKNYSFNSDMKNDSLIFNYKLHKGICYDFNASALMKKSGIEII